ncbi:metallophosphoesterase family protein [Verrucomicrobiota bacterium sgz303538]
MRTLVHLSDIHFGRTDPVLVKAVQEYVTELQPHVTVISGDFTQRARKWQFQAGREFMDSLPGAKIAVPGNHDVPLWNVFARFVVPLANYRRYITKDLDPLYRDDELVVIGVNTARSLTWKGGRINRRQVEFIRERLCGVNENVIKVVVTHHPFDLPEGQDERDLVGRARMAMQGLAECGADVLLSGHLHHAYTGGTAKRYQIKGHSALVVQAGTATSTRLRGSANSFNVLRIDPPRVVVEILSWDASVGQFVASEAKTYERDPELGFIRLDR